MAPADRSGGPRCPSCKQAVSREGNGFFPFCCERCKMVDLGKWLAEEYRIPGEQSGETEAEEEEKTNKE